jgi:hypothetical protein
LDQASFGLLDIGDRPGYFGWGGALELVLFKVVLKRIIYYQNLTMSMWRKAAIAVFAGCLLSAEATLAQMVPADAPTKPTCTDTSPKCQSEQESYRLASMVYGCQEKKKVVGNFTYSICLLRGKVVTASESLTEAGDGMGYFFKNGKVAAIRFFHDGSLAVFEGGKLKTLYEEVSGGGATATTKFSQAQRQNLETSAASGYRSILKKFGR